MGSDLGQGEKKVYKVVLTGGPCGGKTTGQARLSSFFEKLGWKVLRVPETATVLLGGGIKFSELNEEQGVRFQEDLLRTMIQIENTFFTVAEALNRNVLVICDRGAMDASAFISQEQWDDILHRNNWNDVELRDSRYNQVIHMVSAANGAEKFYSIEEHACRSEGIVRAQELDHLSAQAWVGHPYFDMIDNSTDFETKLNRMIQSVCVKLGIDVSDRLESNSRKVKFLIKGPLPPDEEFPVDFRDFTVIHNYLRSSGIAGTTTQGRLRKRGYKNHWSYTYTIRRPLHGQSVEVKTTLTARDYALMLTNADMNHNPVYKTRRCFLLNDQYFQMDIYKEPWHPRCAGLILLETYSTLKTEDLYKRLPNFLTIVKEVTGDPRYSMFNLSLKDGWQNNKHFSSLLSTPNLNGSSNGNGTKATHGANGDATNEAKEKEKENERNESFLACCDIESMKHHIANGSCGINGSINRNSCSSNNGGSNGTNGKGATTPTSPGSGKFKGYEENGHNANAATVTSNGNGTSNSNGHGH